MWPLKIRVAIVGCGSIAEFRHAPEYASNPNVEIVAYYNPDKKKAEKLAEKYGGRVVDSYQEIMEDNTIDAISDCSTNEMHHIITTSALQHGKHVLCEKPIATTIEGANMIVNAQKESGKILIIAHNQRLAQAHKEAKNILKSGELGKVLSFKTSFGHKGPEYWSVNKSKATWFFNKVRSGLGVAGDLGVHKIDLIRYLLDDKITEISALQGTLNKKNEEGNPIEVCDNMVCVLKTENNVLGTASFSWTYYGEEDNSTILYCEKGIMEIYDDPEYQITISKIDGEKLNYKLEELQTNDNQTNSGMIGLFVDCILNNRTSPITGDDGLIALKVILAAIESAEKGKKIIIE